MKKQRNIYADGTNRFKVCTRGGRWGEKCEILQLRAFRSTPLCLPIVVARASLLVAIGTRRNAQTFGTTLVAEKQAWLLVLCL